MTTYKEGKHAADFILWEEGGTLSRDNVEVAVGQKFGPGTILKAGVPYTGGAGPGLAIAIYGVDTTAETGSGEATKVACITRNAEVNRHQLNYPDGFDDADIDAAAVELAKQMVVVRGAPLPSPSESVAAASAGDDLPSPGDQSADAQRRREAHRRREDDQRRRDEQRARGPQPAQVPVRPAPGPAGGAAQPSTGGAGVNQPQGEPRVQRPGDEPLKS